MASWRDKLQPASFRGVPFKVDAADWSGGRRLQVHEYPQRDKPFVEDLGRKSREIAITAFVLGDDYAAQRDKLLEALERGGAGELVHPWYGALQVEAAEYRYSESSSEGRMCRFTFTCHESGELSFPKISDNAASQVGLAADALDVASVDSLANNFSIAGAMSVKLTALDQMKSALGSLEKCTGFAGLAMSVSKDLVNLIKNPRLMGQKILNGLMSYFPLLGRGRGLFSAVSGLLRAAMSFAKSFSKSSSPSSYYAAKTPARIAKNQQAIDRFFRQAALSVAARAMVQPALPVVLSSATGAASNSYVASPAGVVSKPVVQPSYDEQKAVGQDLTQQLEHEQTQAPDVLFRPLAALRNQVVVANKQNLVGAVKLATMTPVAVLPAVVIAYNLYQDARRGDEIVERNAVAHPGFVSAEPLKVLSK